MAASFGAINFVSPTEIGALASYDGTAGTGLVATLTGLAMRTALAQAGAPPESLSPLRWWYAQSFVASAAAGRARYMAIGAGILAPGAITRAGAPYIEIVVIDGPNQNPMVNVNANGDDVEVTFLGAVACGAYVKLGVKPSFSV